MLCEQVERARCAMRVGARVCVPDAASGLLQIVPLEATSHTRARRSPPPTLRIMARRSASSCVCRGRAELACFDVWRAASLAQARSGATLCA